MDSKKRSVKFYALIPAILLIFLFGCSSVSELEDAALYYTDITSEQEFFTDTQEDISEISSQTESVRTGTSQKPQESDSGESSDEMKASRASGKERQGSCSSKKERSSSSKKSSSQSKTQSQTSGSGDVKYYTFASDKLLDQHFAKHNDDFGYANTDEYVDGANRVINDKNSLHKLEAEDGDDVYYLESTNEIVIVAKRGFIRTYFKPRRGIDYYNDQ